MAAVIPFRVSSPSSTPWSGRFAGDARAADHPVQTIAGRVLGLKQFSEDGYELTLERGAFMFDAGMNVVIHGRETTEDREYTICSGPTDQTLQILFRRMETGLLTQWLARLREGDPVRFTGPHGSFTVRDPNRPIVFVGTGTGIAPCRAYIRGHRIPDLTVLQGARFEQELYYREEFSAYTYVPCVSRESDLGLPAYVTHALKSIGARLDAHYYLCGAYEMIHEVSTFLLDAGLDRESIITEAYYYRAEP